MLPILIGLGIGALMGGGIAALQKKNVLEGALLGGAMGAGGAMLAPAAAGIGVGAAGAGAGAGAAGAGVGATGAAGAAGVAGAGTTAASGAASLFPTTLGGATGAAGGAGGVSSILVPGATTGVLAAPTVAGAGAGAGTGIGGFLGANQYALLGGLGGGMMASGQKPPSPDQGNIYTTEFSQEKNPNFGAPGESYYDNQQYAGGTFTPVGDYKPNQMAANGGIIALAEGGDVDRYTRQERTVDPAVTAYNAQLMERANQQYNVNPRPAANQVPGSMGYMSPSTRAAAPINNDSISGIVFNPVTRQYEGEFLAPGTKKKSPVSDDYEGYMRQNQNYDMGNSGGGEKNGGLMTETMRYALGGGISNLGDYSDGGRLLKGPGDGVSDSIPAMIGAKQPARLADGEFVVPARAVSEIGNGSTDAGAKQLYSMLDRIQKGRKKSIGKGKVAVDSKAAKYLPA